MNQFVKYALVFASLLAILPAGPEAHASPPDTANPHASKDAQKLLQYMKRLTSRKDRRVISGQFAGHVDDSVRGHGIYIRELHDQTGKWVAMIGGDFEYMSPDAPKDLPKMTSLMIDYWNRGGLVTIMWNAPNPWTGAGSHDRTMNGSLADLIKPGTKVYPAWMASLDKVAGLLDIYQKAGVVILWRPFHEMNLEWSWWGPRNPSMQKEFIALWRHMFEYFTNVRRLNNLLWVYSPSPQHYPDLNPMLLPPEALYPGDDTVDIVGLDTYTDDLSSIYGDRTAFDRGYAKLVAIGKPFGLTEYGPSEKTADHHSFDYSALIRQIREKYPKICFFQAWSGRAGWWLLGRRQWAMSRHLNARELFNDPWIISREDLSWR